VSSPAFWEGQRQYKGANKKRSEQRKREYSLELGFVLVKLIDELTTRDSGVLAQN
jgi:hypothetical protein